MEEVFGNNIEPGGLKNILDIKILLAYLLSLDSAGTEEEILLSAVMSEGLVNYFDFSTALDEMKTGGQITVSEENEGKVLSLTELGTGLSYEFYKAVPLSVREKCGKAFLKIIARRNSEKHNKAVITPKDGGYILTATVEDMGSVLMKTEIYFPDENTASAARELFLNGTSDIYSKIITAFSESNL